MSKYADLMKLAFFTLVLYIWTAETIVLPGEKQGEAKKDFVLREFNQVIDTKFPNVPWIDAIQALISKALGLVIDWVVAKMKSNADMAKLQAELANFF